ncbi:MAG: hypothetical protein HeimC3_29160 [Candidatus Heimdallarchaeota archaeon LC_3]|nr:MAG: hypothetical protein HeimC3_29160 [Candidatus Heimdallarchaeota archaeon LC_3]
MSQKLITNNDIVEFLISSRENVEILSYKLIEHSKLFSTVDELYSENESNLGKIIKEDDLEKILAVVKKLFFKSLNLNLESENFPIIKLKKTNKRIDQDGEEYISKGSNKFQSEIRMNYDREIRFTTTIIHSIFHYLFDKTYEKSYMDKYDCIDEGLARYGSIILAHKLKYELNNDLYLYDVYEDALSDIWETLVWLEKKHQIKLGQIVEKSYPFKKTSKEKKGKKPDIYARGYCYFLIKTHNMSVLETQEYIMSFFNS